MGVGRGVSGQVSDEAEAEAWVRRESAGELGWRAVIVGDGGKRFVGSGSWCGGRTGSGWLSKGRVGVGVARAYGNVAPFVLLSVFLIN